MRLMKSVFGCIAVWMCLNSPSAAWPAPATSRALFQWIESKNYEVAEAAIRENLEFVRGEERNIYLFVLAFVMVKEGRLAEARAAAASIDPKSEWAEEGQFLLRTYSAKPSVGPDVRIRIAEGDNLQVGRDRFTRSGGALRKNGKTVPAPFVLPSRTTYQSRAYRGKLEMVVDRGRVVLINTLPVEQYLYGVLKNEIGPTWHESALKAQAIASRTFILRRMELAEATARGPAPVALSADVSIQVYRGLASEDPRVTAAVDATRGQALMFRGELIEAVFHSESGGVTESSEELWGRRLPYLLSNPDPYGGTSPRTEWEAEFGESELLKAIVKLSQTKIGNIRALEISEKTGSGRAKTIWVKGGRADVTFAAGKFRLAVGPDKLRSLLWDEAVYQNGRLRVKGRGWGHGVGMPQWSAKAAAENGMTPAGILRLYFPGTEIVTKY